MSLTQQPIPAEVLALRIAIYKWLKQKPAPTAADQKWVATVEKYHLISPMFHGWPKTKLG